MHKALVSVRKAFAVPKSLLWRKGSLGGLVLDLTWSSQSGGTDRIYRHIVDIFFFLCQYPRPLTPLTVTGLVKFQFRAVYRLFRLEEGPRDGGEEINADTLRRNVII